MAATDIHTILDYTTKVRINDNLDVYRCRILDNLMDIGFAGSMRDEYRCILF